jgi:hypothetical protein
VEGEGMGRGMGVEKGYGLRKLPFVSMYGVQEWVVYRNWKEKKKSGKSEHVTLREEVAHVRFREMAKDLKFRRKPKYCPIEMVEGMIPGKSYYPG